MKTYILYNPIAGHGASFDRAEKLHERLGGDTVLVNVTEIESNAEFFGGLDENDTIVICGGDGTLNRFARAMREVEIKNDIYYCATGSGNDFLNDLGLKNEDDPIKITDYLKDLPTATVNGVDYPVLNGVGFGLDGYCCQVGDELKAKQIEDINYTAIAIKGLLIKFKPRNATVTVDGVEHHFNKVWIAPTMHGRFYGGGMMTAPGQKRNNPEGELTTVIFHDSGRFQTLMIFPSIFKGEHIKHEKNVTLLHGKDITVEFDEPSPLQIDGETIPNVKSYRIKH